MLLSLEELCPEQDAADCYHGGDPNAQKRSWSAL
jgi:hypothetical protein